MASTFQLLLDGEPADEALYTVMGALEVEENADLPGAFQLNLPVDRSEDGDLTQVSDARFGPLVNVAIVATPEGKSPECILDGYVLAHKLHLETGITASTLQIWGQDASWLMNLEEKAHEWVDMTDATVANTIFDSYGITPAAENTEDDSPVHAESGHTLMQRATDIQFLRNLARRNGKLCRVVSGSAPGELIGYFAKPKLDGEPSITLRLNDPTVWNVDALDIEWDVMRPSAVQARQASFTDDAEDGIGVDLADSGLEPLDERSLANFAGETMSVQLTAPVDDAGELTLRAQSLLREAGWFVRCEGETEVSRLQAVMRVGQIVMVEGIGSLHSGKYLVWSVRHTLTADAHRMKFVLVRNAVGPEPSGSGGLLDALL
jgi:hypothetical protein